jgi:hypothetical protein
MEQWWLAHNLVVLIIQQLHSERLAGQWPKCSLLSRKQWWDQPPQDCIFLTRSYCKPSKPCIVRKSTHEIAFANMTPIKKLLLILLPQFTENNVFIYNSSFCFLTLPMAHSCLFSLLAIPVLTYTVLTLCRALFQEFCTYFEV